MRNVAARTLAWFALLLISSQFGFAQPPQGRVVFDFGPSNAPVWDLTGPYLLDQPMTGAGGSAVPLSYSVFVNHDVSGRLSGSGTTFVNIDGQIVAGSYTVSGRVSGGGNTTRAQISVRVLGFDSISGAPRRFSIRTNYRLEVDAEGLVLSGSVRGNVSISGLSGSTIRSDAINLALPAGANGAWSLTMDILPLSKLVGTGSITISSFVPNDLPGGFEPLRVLPVNVSGSYRPSTDLSAVTATGLFEARGTRLSVKFQADAPQPTSMTGKILGQTIKQQSQ